MKWYEDLKKSIFAITPGYINYCMIEGICVISNTYGNDSLHLEIDARTIEGERTNICTRIMLIKEFMESEEYLEDVKRQALRNYRDMIIKIIIWCNERQKEDPA